MNRNSWSCIHLSELVKGFSFFFEQQCMYVIHFNNEILSLTKNITETIGGHLKNPHSCKEKEKKTHGSTMSNTIREKSDSWPAACKLDFRATRLLQSMVTSSLISCINLISLNNPVSFVQLNVAIEERDNRGVCKTLFCVRLCLRAHLENL